MVGVSDVDSSSAYSTSSSRSSEDEGDRRKGRKLSKNLSGLSCFARDVFCTMALSSGKQKSTQSDSDSDSDDEVRDELPFLRQENERLGLLLDNRDDMLREAKKMRKELRASLEDARTRVADLETQNLDAKLEIDSLKASPVVSDEVECADCPIFLADLSLFKEKHAKYYNKKVKVKQFAEGDLVWKALLPIGTKYSTFGKWSPNWEGPFRVVRCTPGNAYILKTLLGEEFTAAINRRYLKKYYPSIEGDR
jgi:hypothetical protein